MAIAGYDSPRRRLAEDELDRRRLALDISELIRSTPSDISARIGIFGRWGAGKSTVLEMMADLLSAKGYVIVRLNPSTSDSFSDLIAQFADNLVASFITSGLYAETRWKSYLRKVRSWLSSKNTSALVDGLGELHKGAKLANAGLALITTWLAPDGQQVRKLREVFPETRVLVLIDDLDRCPSALLPKLLLTMREVLDIERFIFVLAFDEEIVDKALTTENPAWDDGHKFLEKILDFRFLLPDVSPAYCLKLLTSEIKARASYIPLGSEAEIEDLLPTNPRRIKALVRSVMGLRPTIERHNPGEFSWVDVWLVELLRQESPLAVEKLNDDSLFQDILGLSYSMLSHARKRGEATRTQEDPEVSFVRGLHLRDKESEIRVAALLEAIRSRGSRNVDYVMRFASRAPAVTWKEFHEGVIKWQESQRPQTLEGWL